MTEPAPRQVLYALVAAAFVTVVGVLVAGAAVSGLAPGWWTWAMAVATAATAGLLAVRWRRTTVVLGASIGLLVVWTTGTLLLA
jgi:hypothetical protein